MNTMTGIPSWRMISLKESSERRHKMTEQFVKYGVNDFSFYLTDRWDKIRNKIDYKIEFHHPDSIEHHGTCIAHLENMRQWYLTTDEPYAIFSDDDIDISTCEYWNFTFDDFIKNLPDGWNCVQLMRLISKIYAPDDLRNKLQVIRGRWWGVCALMTREYVKKVLDTHITGTFEYDLRVAACESYNGDPATISYVENVLFVGKTIPLNFPLFVELLNESTVTNKQKQHTALIEYRTKLYRDIWKEHGSTLNIKEALMPS